MQFIISQILLLALVGSALSAAVDNCHMSKMEACGDPLAAFRKKMGQSFPTNEEQALELCDNMKEAYDCAEEYKNKCMTPLQLETMGFLIEGSLTAFDEFCASDSPMRAEYLRHSECLDESSKTEEAKNHYSYVEASLEDLKEKPANKRLVTACCGYQYLVDKSDNMGREKCGQEAVDAFHQVVEMAVSSLPNVFCSGFEPESDQCKEVLPPPGTKPKGTIKNSHIAKTFASIYVPDLQEQ